MNRFIEENMDVLQNIEAMIVTVFRTEPSLLDYDVKDAIAALSQRYRAEDAGKTPPQPNLGERAQKVYDKVATICEVRLGRGTMTAGDGPGAKQISVGIIPLETLVKALREIQKSVQGWTQRAGRRGYLEFVQQYVR
ncbi:MAG: hypothetical protein U0Q16_10120 [Bryobacteraceae bacterium]